MNVTRSARAAAVFRRSCSRAAFKGVKCACCSSSSGDDRRVQQRAGPLKSALSFWASQAHVAFLKRHHAASSCLVHVEFERRWMRVLQQFWTACGI